MNTEHTKQLILFVDDEANILNGLKRMLYPMKNIWEMHFASSGTEALELMKSIKFDIIISDIKMPVMDGPALLKEVKKQHPEVIRFILSGYSDQHQIYNSVGIAHQFICKPCQPENIKNAIKQALALRNIITEPSLISFISEIENLPSIPSAYNQIISLLRKPDVSLNKIAELVTGDVAMSAKILKMVNSAFFSLPNRVNNILQTVTLLGVETIKTLVLMFKIFEPSSNYPWINSSIERLQNHSIKVAAAAKTIARKEQYDEAQTNTLFMSGVLHDIGRLIFLTQKPEEYQKVHSIIGETPAVTVCDAEKQVFGATHGSVGAYLLGLWGFPNENH